jgi:predicted small lipoprotein YifL
MRRALIIAALSLLVTACGVKNDLVKPNGQATPKDQSDPSKPPYPLGR